MTYKEQITAANTALAADPRTIFIGYGLQHGRAMGTLRDVSPAQILETPVAENLMVGLAIGLSLRGRLPVVFIERCDFLLNAMDAIVNHLDKAATLSRGEFTPAVILRIVVGNRQKPLFTGPVHTQDFSEALARMTSLWISKCHHQECPIDLYYKGARKAQLEGQSTAIFEYKDLI